jgi:flagellar biosynthesis anti-sigma factor FlgM
MKIQGRKTPQMSSLGPINIPAHPEPASASEPVTVSDQVDLTSTQQLRKLRAAVDTMPAVRTERVEDLKDAIEEGSYYVESQKLAKKVVDDVLAEALLKETQNKQQKR